jgi:hypothetical protein
MKATKQLGVWMDHSIAYLTELTNVPNPTRTVESKPESKVKEEDLYFKDESHQLNKEQNKLSAYYRSLSNIILNYEEVLLFGPADAKNELFNIIKENHLFDHVKITVKTADKMSEARQQVFVREYFNTGG